MSSICPIDAENGQPIRKTLHTQLFLQVQMIRRYARYLTSSDHPLRRLTGTRAENTTGRMKKDVAGQNAEPPRTTTLWLNILKHPLDWEGQLGQISGISLTFIRNGSALQTQIEAHIEEPHRTVGGFVSSPKRWVQAD
ncbi:hypothetical protein IFR05_017315 [Cadophora sp. M221]|nr:hypothetical protein IFR05_017315 [Cadophora sp. M221]